MRKGSLAAVLFFAAVLPLSASVKVRHPFRDTAPSAGVTKVLVELRGAELIIRETAGDQLILSGQVTRDAREGKTDEVQRILNGISVVYEVRGGVARLRTRVSDGVRPREGRSRHNELALVLEIPSGIDLEVRLTGGEVEIARTAGSVDLQMTGGEVSLKMPKRNVREVWAKVWAGEVSLNLGDRTLEHEGLMARPTLFVNEGGSAVVTLNVRFGEINVVLTE